eukprot:COSAG01_NODE_8319_length_2831_cov_3.274890_4_plen_53_part_00
MYAGSYCSGRRQLLSLALSLAAAIQILTTAAATTCNQKLIRDGGFEPWPIPG